MLKYSKYTNTKNVQCELKKVENANHVYGNKLIMFTSQVQKALKSYAYQHWHNPIPSPKYSS